LEGLLAVVGLAVTTEGIRTGISTERWRERVPHFRAATLKLRASNGVRTKRSREIILMSAKLLRETLDYLIH